MAENGTFDRAHGRWREILPALGVDGRYLSGKHMPCPSCGGRDRFRFTDRDGDGDYYCNGCGAGKGPSLLSKVLKVDYAEACKRIRAVMGDNVVPLRPHPIPQGTPLDRKLIISRMWEGARRIEAGDPVARYLAARAIGMKLPSVLRYLPKMKHKSGGFYPGMLAAFTGPDGKWSTIHRTFLTQAGTKADVDSPRMFIPGNIAKGGAVRLGQMTGGIVGVAEGIETALSASVIHDVPVWATLNEGLLRAWIPPSDAKRIVIFADNDKNFVGQCAAFDLAKRIAKTSEGIAVEVIIPKRVGWDWNDVLQDAMRDDVEDGEIA